MSTAATQPVQDASPRPPADSPGSAPPESDWYRTDSNLLIESVKLHNAGRKDYFVGGNILIYFDVKQEFDKSFRGPDFFYVKNVAFNPLRPFWAMWKERGRYPDVIIELSSPSTAAADHGMKKDVYERTFHTFEYFIYEPDKQLLLGWRLGGMKFRYQPIEPNDKGWLWCEQLGLWLGTWKGKLQGKEDVYLRFFDKDGNLIATEAERKDTAAQQGGAEKPLDTKDAGPHVS